MGRVDLCATLAVTRLLSTIATYQANLTQTWLISCRCIPASSWATGRLGYKTTIFTIARASISCLAPDDTTIIGNNYYRNYVDGISIYPGNNLTIAWNHGYDVRIQNPASLAAGLHPDFFQFANASLTKTNVRVIGNRFNNGDYVMTVEDHGAQGPFSGPNPVPISIGSITATVLTVAAKSGPAIINGMTVYGTNVLPDTTIVSQASGTTGGTGTYNVSQSHVAIGPQAMMATHTIRDSVVAGNMIVIAEQSNMLFFNSWGDSQIYNNTAVMDAAGVLGNGMIYMANPDGLDIRYNIANFIGPDVVQAGVIARTPTTGYAMNNIVLQAAYAATFVDLDSGTGITDLVAQFDTKAGVYTTGTDNMIPGAASAYIDFGERLVGDTWDGTGREHDFPWAESGHDISGDFTDATGIVTSTLTTSNEVTLSGVSATGALVEVSGGTFRVAMNSNDLIRTYGAEPYIVPNGYKITLQNTSSGSASTAVSMTVTVWHYDRHMDNHNGLLI